MFEKEADYRKARKESKDRITKVIKFWSAREETIHDEGFQKGAEFGYNKAMNEIGNRMESAYREGVAFGKDKANEWHYVKDGDFPKGKIENKYLVALKSEYGGFFYELDIWCESLHCFASNNPTKIIAWKEIVLPELKESE